MNILTVSMHYIRTKDCVCFMYAFYVLTHYLPGYLVSDHRS